jgi:hypothetical protein
MTRFTALNGNDTLKRRCGLMTELNGGLQAMMC